MFFFACSSPDPSSSPSMPPSDPLEQVPPLPWVACEEPTGVWINEVISSNIHGLTDEDGETTDWIELAAQPATNLLGWRLGTSPDPDWVFPDFYLSSPQVVFASGKNRTGPELHTDFSLSSDGEELFLVHPQGCIADHIPLPKAYADISYGHPINDPTLAWFLEPTPNHANTTESRPGFAPTPQFLTPPGFYPQPPIVQLLGENLHYSTNGALPTTPYTAPLPLSQTTVVRARASQDGLWDSRVLTGTFIIEPAIEGQKVAVMSLTVDPPDLWDAETGIYVTGTDYEHSYPYFGANFWESWEKDLHVEYWDAGGTKALDQDAGIQIAGGYSRAFDQRNFELLARAGYGSDTFAAPIFDNENIDAFHHLYLRNGGDWCSTQLVDASVQALFRDTEGRRYDSVDAQAYRPVLVLLNGKFWGLYELKERLDQWYIESHHGEDPEALDRVRLGWTHEANWELEQGSWDDFEALNELTAHMASDAAWQAFTEQVDLKNFASAIVAQGWIGNTDWWGNNLRLWKPWREGGKWRWMVYDFGHGWPSYSYDHLATSVSGNWTGLPIAAALAHDAFRTLFINAHADYLNTTLRPAWATAQISALADEIRPVFALQQERWCGGENMASWESTLDYAREFAQKRPGMMDRTLMTHLGLTGHARLSMVADPADAGEFTLTVVTVGSGFSGDYYLNIPVPITATALPGWRFVGWADGETSATRTATLTEDSVFTALFEPAG